MATKPKKPKDTAAQNPLATETLMTPGEVARLFRVDTNTVIRWAAKGRLRTLRTPGGHRRFYTQDVRAMLTGSDPA